MLRLDPVPEIRLAHTMDTWVMETIAVHGSKKLCLVTGPRVLQSHHCSQLIHDLRTLGLEVQVVVSPGGEPSIDGVSKLLTDARMGKPDLVLAVGGGSVLDAAKVVAVLVDKEYGIEALYDQPSLMRRSIPLVVIPTSAGSGSEVSPIAILTDTMAGLKRGLVSPALVPDHAGLYGELCTSLSPKTTAESGLDAVCHACESCLSTKAHPQNRALAMTSLEILGRWLVRAWEFPQDVEARTMMLQASYLAGLAFSQASVTAVHACAYPLGGRYDIPHGLSNAMMFPPVFRHNTAGNEATMIKLSLALGGEATSKGLVGRFLDLRRSLCLPKNLQELGVPRGDLPGLADQALGVKRLMDANPVPVSHADVLAWYESAWVGE